MSVQKGAALCWNWESTIHRRTPVSAGNTFQDLTGLRKTADNTERYIQGVPRVKVTTSGECSLC